MAGLKAPEEFDLDSSNAKQEWNTWIEQYDLYACATELDSKDEKIQIAIDLHWCMWTQNICNEHIG